MTVTTAEAELVRGLLRDLGISPADLALAVKVHARTVDRWAAGDTPQRNGGRERLHQLAALRDRLCTLIGPPERMQAWLRADSRYLGGLSPLDALCAGRIDRVEAAVEALASGIFL